MKDRVGSLLFIVLASLIAFQCTPPTMATQSNATKISRSDFPADFIFGAASSAYQVEGAAREGGRGMSIWDTFTHKQSNKIKGGSNGDKGVNSYHMYKEDVKILKNLGLDAYRFSISWPRLLPSGKLNDGVNKEGINYYNNLINELLANGITPYVTLFHWDVPQALEDEYGGFLSPKIVDDFTDYVELCFWEFGDRVKNWITLNEPWTFSYRGYVTATFAPGRGNPGTEPYWVAHNLLLAHAAAVELYKTKFQNGQEGQIGITLVSHWMEPLDENSESDIKAAKRALDFMFGWFMEPLTYGDYPESMKKLVGSRLPRFSAEQSKKIKGSYDFLGLNYYTGYYVTTAPKNSSESNNLSYSTDIHITYATERNGVLIGPQAGSAWLHIYPEGIRKLLVYIKKTYNAPLIYITENGVDEEDNPNLTLSDARVDNVRIKYLQDHLFNVQLAINDGVNVKGYIIWTLLDNFEWADGYTLRFGIIYVNYKDNFARYPKASAIWLMNNFGKKHSKLPIKRSVIEEEDEEQVPNKKSRKLKWSLWDITKSL